MPLEAPMKMCFLIVVIFIDERRMDDDIETALLGDQKLLINRIKGDRTSSAACAYAA